MEVASLVLGVVGAIKPLIDGAIYLCDLHQSSAQFGLDANALRVRITAAKRQTKTFEDILLANKRFDWLSGSLFHELDPSLQQEFYDLLQELSRCLVSFVEIGKSYGVGSYNVPSAPKQIAGREAQIIDSDERAKAHQKAISWVKRVVWSAKDKKALTKIVKDIEHWTDLLRITIQDVITNSPELKELDRLDHIGKGLDEQAADLQLALSIRRILLTKPINLPLPAPVIPTTDVSILSTIDGITLGILRSSQASVLIEKKYFGATNPTEDAQRLIKSKHLATLLQHATDPAWRVLNAQGYNYDPLQHCATIMYEVPSNLLPSPTTLQQLYTMKLREARPSLEIRFQLALVVTESIFFLHSLGWVHKSFSSSHVLFFPQKALRNNPWSADGHAQERVSIDQILRQSDIKIAGFELSRPEAEQSSLSMHGDVAENFYRHPARWGLPTEAFTFTHDLYALGAVLLELGLWQKLDTLDHRASTNDPLRVKQLLLSHATQRLPYTMGSKYASIVVGYLKGQFEDTSRNTLSIGWNMSTPNHAAIRLAVLRSLNAASTCL